MKTSENRCLEMKKKMKKKVNWESDKTHNLKWVNMLVIFQDKKISFKK